MNQNIIRQIKRIVITALCSDDEIMESLSLKGGSAIQEFYNVRNKARSSIDLDYSLSQQFEDFEAVKNKIEQILHEEFNKSDFRIIDFDFYENPDPQKVKNIIYTGYKIEFKVISKDLYDNQYKNIKSKRLQAFDIDGRKSFKIEFSNYEFIQESVYKNYENFDVKIYTPEMIVCEKLRALCQQTFEYRKFIDSERHPKGRARDFYDIYYLVTNFKIDIKNNLDLLRSVFSAKQVELSVLQYVESMYKLHKADEASLQATVSPEIYESFDVYFNYVIGLIKIILSQEI